MKTIFLRKGDTYLPAGNIEPEELESSLKEWLTNSFLPLLAYLEKEICREFTLIPQMLSYRISCPVYDTSDIATLREMNDLILSEAVCKSLMQFELVYEITCKVPGVEWGVGFGFELSETVMKFSGAEIKCYGIYLVDELINLEEDLSIGTAEVVAEVLLTNMRKAYIQNS